eukprot:1160076-Pelagomonas_calceolata.AAC.2
MWLFVHRKQALEGEHAEVGLRVEDLVEQCAVMDHDVKSKKELVAEVRLMLDHVQQELGVLREEVRSSACDSLEHMQQERGAMQVEMCVRLCGKYCEFGCDVGVWLMLGPVQQEQGPLWEVRLCLAAALKGRLVFAC